MEHERVFSKEREGLFIFQSSVSKIISLSRLAYFAASVPLICGLALARSRHDFRTADGSRGHGHIHRLTNSASVTEILLTLWVPVC